MHVIMQINTNCVNCKQNEEESLSCIQRTAIFFRNIGE